MVVAVPDRTSAGSPLFALRNAGYRVDGCDLLREVGLDLHRGRVYGLIGRNGSGKTTLMKLLARQQAATFGEVLFEDRVLADWSPKAFARQVAYMAQTLPGTTGMTVRELTALGRYPWHGALGRFARADRDSVRRALELTDMAALAQRPVDTLSGGERQRAWLAMLVAQDSGCMLLDEPISALDVAHQVEVMDLIRWLCRERGLTVVTVLHDVNMAARFCDEIVALRDGRRIATGPARDVIRSDVLERIYGVAMGVLDHPDRSVPICYVA